MKKILEMLNHKSMQIILGILFIIPALFMHGWPGFILFIISYGILGGEVLLKALHNIRHGQIFDENFLMGIATLGAIGIGEYQEAIAVMLFYRIGEYFQDFAVDKSMKSIASLMNIRPDSANIKNEGGVKTVLPEQVEVGDILVVSPGERVALDGKVLQGKSAVDLSALTGESLPKDIFPGSLVLSGSINLTGLLEIEVTSLYENSTVHRILDLVENAGNKKARQEQFITRFARVYTPLVVGIGVLLFLIPTLIYGDYQTWLYRALTFLVVSCPCALVVSVPLTFFAGMGGASKAGILVKGGNYLEALARAEVVVFDKTGTLTKGIFEVVEKNPAEGWTKTQLLELATYGEANSNHPIGQSILRAYGREPDKSRITEVEEISGQGIRILMEGEEVLVGNIALMKGYGIKAQEVFREGTLIHVGLNREYIGHLLIADALKKDGVLAIARLKELGIKRIVMFSGDEESVVKKVALELGIDSFYGNLMPGDKVTRLEEIMEKSSGPVVFVGDGINDAPVLARADIGIAMGGIGSDAALEAADVVIMDDQPSKVAQSIVSARKILRIAQFNIVFAIGVKTLVLFFSAIGYVSLWAAVFADVGVTILAVINAMRGLRVTKD